MGDYTFKKKDDGTYDRYRNSEYQESALNSEVQLLQRIEGLQGKLDQIGEIAFRDDEGEESDAYGDLNAIQEIL